MIKYLSSKVLPLSHDLAANFAAMPAVAGERPLKAARLAFLAERLKEGTFYPPRWARTLVLATGAVVRVNGQHSSTLLRDLPDPPAGMKVILDEFEVADDHEAALLFMQFDAPESARGLSDITRAQSRIHPSLTDVSDRAILRVMTGVTLAKKITTGVKKISLHEKGKLVHQAAPFIARAAKYVLNPVMSRAPVFAAMQLTFDTGAADWESFWQAVADQSNPDKDHPTRLINRMLEDLRAFAGAAKARKAARLDDRAVAARCLYGWNAHVEGKTISGLRYSPKEEFPFARIPDAATPAPALENATA